MAVLRSRPNRQRRPSESSDESNELGLASGADDYDSKGKGKKDKGGGTSTGFPSIAIAFAVVLFAIMGGATLHHKRRRANGRLQHELAMAKRHHMHAASCTLYLAPSSIPGAGLGIYTAVDVPPGAIVGAPGDPAIAIEDEYKTLPYRGQHRFLPWLAHVWPAERDAFHPLQSEKAMPPIPEAFRSKTDEGLSAAEGVAFKDGDGHRVNAFAPGVAALANSQRENANVQQAPHAQREDWAGLDPEHDVGVGAFSSLHGVAFAATEPIAAGAELFLDYGEEWHARQQKREEAKENPSYLTLEDYRERVDKKRLPTEEERKRKQKNRRTDLEERLGTIDGIDGRFTRPVEEKKDGASPEEDEWSDRRDDGEARRTDTERGSHRNANTKEGQAPETTSKEDEQTRDRANMPPVDWLQKHGTCIDNLRAGRSTVAQAGRGAFAKGFIPGGAVVAPAPLLVLKRDDLDVYEIDEGQSNFRDVLDLDDGIAGRELLLNYCYGRAGSPLLLLPYAPIVNLINHSGEAPNAAIRWPAASSSLHGDPKDWLDLHPVDVVERSGRLMVEFVALRDIQPGEEVFLDYGSDWEEAWEAYTRNWNVVSEGEDDDDDFRQEIGVPEGFFPDGWNRPAVYELAPPEAPLRPGEIAEIKWAHNGHAIAESSGIWRIGLPPGFSARLREYADRRGITDLYEKLLYEDVLDDEEWFVFRTEGEEWYAQRYASREWAFNMHYIAAWDEKARLSFLRVLGDAGYDTVLEGMGNHFGLDNLTCFHNSFMGITEADTSVTHADLYATDGKAFNVFTSVLLVNGSKPELDIQGDDANVVVSINYDYDTAYILGDWGYHKTAPADYTEEGHMRIVISTYCAQIDEANAKMMAYIYEEEDSPAVFIDQFELPLKEAHWKKGIGWVPSEKL